MTDNENMEEIWKIIELVDYQLKSNQQKLSREELDEAWTLLKEIEVGNAWEVEGFLEAHLDVEVAYQKLDGNWPGWELNKGCGY